MKRIFLALLISSFSCLNLHSEILYFRTNGDTVTLTLPAQTYVLIEFASANVRWGVSFYSSVLGQGAPVTPNEVLAPDTYYLYTGGTDTLKVIEYNEGMHTVREVVRLIKEATPAGVEVNEKQETFEVFPNPSTDQLFFKIADRPIKEVNIYSADGTLVIKSNRVTHLDVSQLSPGLYVAEIVSEGSFLRKRWVKM
jgi:hypothetical protein